MSTDTAAPPLEVKFVEYPPDMATKMVIAAERAKSQAFFAELAASITAPHIHDQYKRNIEELLKRATERGLYTP